MKNEPTQNVKLNVINQHIILNHMITKILMNGYLCLIKSRDKTLENLLYRVGRNTATMFRNSKINYIFTIIS